MGLANKAEKVLEEYAEKKMPRRIKKLVSAANDDLYSGPSPKSRSYPGFTKACEEISAWYSDEMPGECWVDMDAEYVMEKEPEGYTNEEGEWEEPFLENTYHFEDRDVKRAVFGRELAGHI